MAHKMGIYKCMESGVVVEVFVEGEGDLLCCDEEMKQLDEKNKEGAGEKHLPVVESTGNGGILVKVGSVPHPMDAEHWIQFIEVVTKDNYVLRKNLCPGDKPEASFHVEMTNVSAARELCNKHGLWSKM